MSCLISVNWNINEYICLILGTNGFNTFWVMCAMMLCIVAVGISPTLATILKTLFKKGSLTYMITISVGKKGFYMNDNVHVGCEENNIKSREVQ